MTEARIDQILDAAYVCFTRFGMRRTTMDDIAAEAGMSRPAVYQYVRNKDDTYRRLAERLFDRALAAARDRATAEGGFGERLTAVLDSKLELTLRLWRDSPHAAELLAGSARLPSELVEGYTTAMTTVITDLIADAAKAGEIALDLAPADAAEVLVAFVRGLEADPVDPDRSRAMLRHGVALLTVGLTPRRRTSP